MREAIKSAVSLSWATSLFAATQATRVLTNAWPDASRAIDNVTRAAASELGDDADDTSAPSRSPAPTPAGDDPVLQQHLRSVVVLGEGLAAGVGDFALSEESQGHSFVAQAARQAGAPFLIPFLQEPGIYGAPGLAAQPVVLPHLLQTTVVPEFPLARRYNNLSIPGYELADCLERRPTPPLVHRDDARQTIANLVLGLPALTTAVRGERPTQLEYAVQSAPSLAIVELGLSEILRFTLSRSGGSRPEMAGWAAAYERVVRTLRAAGAEVVVATVLDPTDTAGLLPLDRAARALRVGVSELQQRYGLAAGDHVTMAGLTTAAFHLLGGTGTEIAASHIVRANTVAEMRDRVAMMNDAIAATTRQLGTHLLDLHRLARHVSERGLTIAGRAVTADFLGGFYTLNGIYPGAAGHAVLANELLTCLNRAFGARLPLVDVEAVAMFDRAFDYRAPGGSDRPVPPTRPARPHAVARSGSTIARPPQPPRLRLPASLEMTAPLVRSRSYHGDAIRVVDCGDAAESRFGSCAGVLFGGPVLFDSHLSGSIRIRFSPPQGDRARFEIAFDPLAGDDGVLSAPMFFRWPVLGCQVVCEPGVVSSGTVDLTTGESHDLTLSVRYLNSALQALVSVNPGFPDQPIVFPGQYGSAWAKFEQREDGGLDFTFYGSTFLPLGGQFGDDTVRWALPFAGAPFEFASIPSRGIALHPHLQLTTREADEAIEPAEPDGPIELPHNTVCEMTLFTRRSSFGDKFTLNTPELGGPATGRSHLLGRLLMQTGEPFAGSMPVALWLMAPGGLLGQQPPTPLASLFPGRLSPGPVGHDEHLRFPVRNYFLDAVTLVDDPFDFSVGAVDLASGRFLSEVLHRGFIGQDLFFSLIRVEPRTPRASFLFRGPAALRAGARGDLLFRQRAVVRIPYPAGFGFPAPDLTSAIVVGDGSILDPYLWLRASSDDAAPEAVSLGRDRVRSSTGDEFSYRLDVREGGGQPLAFEYANHAQAGAFRLETVSWFTRARVPTPHGESDVYTFAGFGRWSKDPTGRAHQVSAQIAVGGEEYVSVQIDAGLVSNVNTRPAEEAAAYP